MFWNGSTAMEGLSGRASGGAGAMDFVPANAKTCTGRAMFFSSISPLSTNAMSSRSRT